MTALTMQNDLSLAATTGALNIDDPGNGKALPNDLTGTIDLISVGAAETRTLAVPDGVGLRLTLAMKTDGGDIVVTVASAYNQNGATTLTFDTAGDYVVLESVQVGTAKAWRVAAVDGVAIDIPAQNFTADGLTVGGLIVDPYKEVTINCLLNADCVDQAFYTAQRAMQVVGVTEIHATAGDHASAVNLQITKDTGTNAPGAGTDLLTNNTNAGFNLKGTANTLQTGTLTATTASLQLAAGNRLSLDFAGDVQTLAGVQVTVRLKPI